MFDKHDDNSAPEGLLGGLALGRVAAEEALNDAVHANTKVIHTHMGICMYYVGDYI
jgi:hypothetical protein